MDKRIEELAQSHNMTPDKIRAELESNNGFENMRSEIMASKTMTELLENAKIKK
jgi:hypothetical protein